MARPAPAGTRAPSAVRPLPRWCRAARNLDGPGPPPTVVRPSPARSIYLPSAVSAVERAAKVLGRTPSSVAFDGGFAARQNLTDIRALGLKNVDFSSTTASPSPRWRATASPTGRSETFAPVSKRPSRPSSAPSASIVAYGAAANPFTRTDGARCSPATCSSSLVTCCPDRLSQPPQSLCSGIRVTRIRSVPAEQHLARSNLPSQSPSDPRTTSLAEICSVSG
jgi:hypothetical protein